MYCHLFYVTKRKSWNIQVVKMEASATVSPVVWRCDLRHYGTRQDAATFCLLYVLFSSHNSGKVKEYACEGEALPSPTLLEMRMRKLLCTFTFFIGISSFYFTAKEELKNPVSEGEFLNSLACQRRCSVKCSVFWRCD